MSQEEHKKHSLISDTDTKRDIRKKRKLLLSKKIMKYFMIALLVIVLVGDSLLGITLKEKHNQLIQLKQNLFHLKLNKAHLSKKYQKHLKRRDYP